MKICWLRMDHTVSLNVADPYHHDYMAIHTNETIQYRKTGKCWNVLTVYQSCVWNLQPIWNTLTPLFTSVATNTYQILSFQDKCFIQHPLKIIIMSLYMLSAQCILKQPIYICCKYKSKLILCHQASYSCCGQTNRPYLLRPVELPKCKSNKVESICN